MESWINRQIGKCRLEEQLGIGGVGLVYKARHLLLDKIVAVKLLHPDLISGEGGSEIIERFIREARAAAKLEHPNVIPIYDIGEEDGVYYIVMQFMSGGTLLDILDKHGKMSVIEVLWITKEVAKGLQAAHEKGIIHRDIKPANILLSGTGEVKITDFGLAKQIDDDSHISQVGRVFGTPLYLSPEQAVGDSNLDGRADIYSLGVTVFQALTGSPPYTGKTSYLIMQQHVAAPIPTLYKQLPGVAQEVEYLLHKLMEKKRDNRFSTAAEVVEYIEKLENLPLWEELQLAQSRSASNTRKLPVPKRRSVPEMAKLSRGLQEISETPAAVERNEPEVRETPESKKKPSEPARPPANPKPSEPPRPAASSKETPEAKKKAPDAPRTTVASKDSWEMMETKKKAPDAPKPPGASKETRNIPRNVKENIPGNKIRIKLGEAGVECIPEVGKADARPKQPVATAPKEEATVQPAVGDLPSERKGIPPVNSAQKIANAAPSNGEEYDKIRIQLGHGVVECISLKEPAEKEEQPAATPKEDGPIKKAFAEESTTPPNTPTFSEPIGDNQTPKSVPSAVEAPVYQEISQKMIKRRFVGNSISLHDRILLAIFVIVSLLLFIWLLSR